MTELEIKYNELEASIKKLKLRVEQLITELENYLLSKLNLNEGYGVKIKHYLFNNSIWAAITYNGEPLFGTESGYKLYYTNNAGEVLDKPNLAFNPLGGMGSFDIDKDLYRLSALQLQTLLLEERRVLVGFMLRPEVLLLKDLITEFSEIKEQLSKKD